MVKITVQGKEFEGKSLHDIEVLTYFPEGSGHVNGVVECLSDVFDDTEFDELLDKMTVEEMLEVWEQWTKASNLDFVYKRMYDVMADQKPKRNKLGRFLLISWFVSVVVAIVSLTLLLT